MNFLAPLFLIGAAAVALPVVFHLIRRTTRERTFFGALLFLRPSPPRVTRRSRIEDWLLLLLRCAAIGLLALGFARPFLRQANVLPTDAAPPRRIAILVDSSASMQRPGLAEAARDRAAEILRRTTPADQVAVFTFARTLEPRITFEAWNAAPPSERAALALARLAEARPGFSGTRLGEALVAATEALADRTAPAFAGKQEIVLVSDLQEGAHLSALQGFDWPRDVRLIVEPVTPRTAGNAGVQILADSTATTAASATNATVRVRISNAADSTGERFQVSWAGADGQTRGRNQESYVPPGQSRIVTLPVPSSPGEPPDRIVLRGDDQPFDNTVFLVPPQAARLPILYLGNDTAEDARGPLYFLRRATPATPLLAIDLQVQSAGREVPPKLLADATAIFVTDAVPDATATAIRQAAVAGKTVVFAPRTAAAAATLARLVDQPAVRAEDIRPPSYALLGELDFRHPLLAGFADPRFSDFSRIHFWKYRRFDTNALAAARVVARFDNGDPAWLDVPAGRGRILVLASGWQPEDSQLALSTKFVPFLFSILEWSGAPIGEAQARFSVGDPLPLGGPAGPDASVQSADGSTIPLPPGATTFAGAATPGVFVVKTATGSRRFAVNLDPAESLTAPRPRDEFERLGIPVAVPDSARPAPGSPPLLNPSETENRQKLWRWFLVATLAVLLLETALAGRAARRNLQPQGTPA